MIKWPMIILNFLTWPRMAASLHRWIRLGWRRVGIDEFKDFTFYPSTVLPDAGILSYGGWLFSDWVEGISLKSLDRFSLLEVLWKCLDLKLYSVMVVCPFKCPLWACLWAENLSNLIPVQRRLCLMHVFEPAGRTSFIRSSMELSGPVVVQRYGYSPI